MELLPAVTAQVSDTQFQLMILPQPDCLMAQMLCLIQQPLTVPVEIFSCRGQGKFPVLPPYQRHTQLFFQRLYLL